MARPTRSATGSTSSFHTGRVASTHSARLHATADPAPDGSDVASSSHRSARRTASSTCGALGGADTRVLGAVGGALGDRLTGDVLGHVPVHRAALVREHLAELLEGGAQVVGVQGTEHRGERVVPAARAGQSSETEGVGRALTATALLVLLLALVAVVRLLRRKAESEWGVTHGIPRLVRPPVLSRRRLPDYTTQRRHRGAIGPRCSADSWPAAGWMPPGTYASYTYVLNTTAGDAR